MTAPTQKVPSSGRVGVGSASGKLIVFGEHAVVYGHPAIAVGLDRGARATARTAERSTLTLAGLRHEVAEATEEPSPARAFGQLLDALRVSGVEATAELDVPSGVGLGASAALGVALARAVLDLLGESSATDRARTGPAAAAWEDVFHGNASGVDAATAERGGCLRFARGEPTRRIVLPGPLSLAVARVEAAPSTRSMVERVRDRRQRDPAGVDAIFVEIGRLAARGEALLREGAIDALGPLLNRNQRLLLELGVSTPALDAACEAAREAGARGAKLTGAGGGGCVLALAADDRRPAVLRAWRERGLQAFCAQVGCTADDSPSDR